MSRQASEQNGYKTVYTIGHSTRPLEDFLHMLELQQVKCLVDVRAFPGSRTNPQYNKDTLEQTIPQAGLDYVHLRALGGRRKRADPQAPSPNSLWRNKSFKNYADYALTEEFHQGLEELLNLTREKSCALMCSEAVWWRCHRRIIADYLLSLSIEVTHIMAANKTMPAKLTRGARIEAPGQIVYAGEEGENAHSAVHRTKP